MIELQTHASIRDVGALAWDALAGADDAPFLRFAWLDALERTGCVGGETGWIPFHLTLHEDGRLIAAAPAYVKTHSQGEFVFDHGWAKAAARFKVRYYPKLIVAVPFTPATAPRLLVARDLLGTPDLTRVRRAFAAGLEGIIERAELSSAHVLFPTDEEALHWREAGLLQRSGVQFHWQNEGYATMDDFLATMNSKRRHQLRREIRELASAGVTLETARGDGLTEEVVLSMHELYLATVDKFYWGQRYLTRAFFLEVASSLRDAIEIVVARDSTRKIIAGALNIRGAKTLFGRYWGTRAEAPFLHFNVCYYHSIRECIERGLARFEPGAGGSHKAARGFYPTLTNSVHAIADARFGAALAVFCEEERLAIETEVRGEWGAPPRRISAPVGSSSPAPDKICP